MESKRRVGERRKEKRIGKARKESREEKKKWTQSGTLELYLIILMSSLMLTWSGTRNLVLSRMGSCFSPLYLSMITLQTKAQTESVSPLLFWLMKFYDGNISCAVFRPDTLTAEQCPWSILRCIRGVRSWIFVYGGKRSQSSACESKVHVDWSKANLLDLRTQTVFLTAVRHLIKLKNAFQISLLQTALQRHTDHFMACNTNPLRLAAQRIFWLIWKHCLLLIWAL